MAISTKSWILIATALILLWTAACNSPDSGVQTADAPDVDAPDTAPDTAPDADPNTVTKGTAYSADGQPIAFDVRGQGDTALVFIHCWSCDRTFWREQLDAVSPDYRVVTLDLAGHGDSGRHRETWTVEGLAADVLAVVGELDLRDVILVGHSMGGPVALAAAAQMPDRTRGIVCVDTLHNAEFEWDLKMAESIVARYEADYDTAMREIVGMMFPTDADAGLIDWVVERARQADRPATMALMRDFPTLDLVRLFAEAQAPIRCINAAPSSPMQPVTEIEINQRHADFDAVLMDGVGHYLMLEQPEAFNAHLRQVLSEM